MSNDAPFSATVVDHDGEVRVVVSGELDLATAPILGAAIEDAVTRGRERVVVDLAAAPFIDSSGINELVRAVHRVDGHATLLVRSPPTQALHVFKVTGVDQFLKIDD
jgi:anti-anti-sigma factor